MLQSEHHERINSITEKIGDDVKHWERAKGKLSSFVQIAYYYRYKVESTLHDVNKAIENREPTWWEQCKDALGGFVVKIMNNLPELERFLKLLPALKKGIKYIT